MTVGGLRASQAAHLLHSCWNSASGRSAAFLPSAAYTFSSRKPQISAPLIAMPHMLGAKMLATLSYRPSLNELKEASQHPNFRVVPKRYKCKDSHDKGRSQDDTRQMVHEPTTYQFAALSPVQWPVMRPDPGKVALCCVSVHKQAQGKQQGRR